ncbi:hypothetical protein H6P81_000740 [Aristolochia fimbriata]|uniref:Aberrant root formation protein 4 n=1 Tax=Aristolochia fimbriata TaxID=158543 RepID=A0AAV7F541_ARIFI|nr:hypothetical protein H6P81_000740 [Aristolochia fimbriata]
MSIIGSVETSLSRELSDRTALLSRVQQTLETCSKSVESGDFQDSSAAVGSLAAFLGSISQTVLSNPENTVWKENVLVVLMEIDNFIKSPSLDQAVVDAVSFELPREVAKFAAVSDKCQELVRTIIECLATRCNPRDILSIFCEALASLSEVFKSPIFYISLFSGISKVFSAIRRRQFEQVKAAMPVILNVLKLIQGESDDEDEVYLRDLISRAVSIAYSIQAVAVDLVGRKKDLLCALLGLYILQTTALITGEKPALSSCTAFVLELSKFLPQCGLSYFGLITGSDVERITEMVLGEGDDDFVSCFSFVKHGATLAVIWGQISDEVAKSVGKDLESLKSKLQGSQIERWQAIGMLSYILTSLDYPWEVKRHGVMLLLFVMDGNLSQDRDVDCSVYIPGIFSALQGLQRIMVYASDAMLRKTAFSVLKQLLGDIPSDQRFLVLKALITNSNSPSMSAILMDLAKEEIFKENSENISSECVNRTVPSCWSSNALELVEFILKPPHGGPPSLPEQSEPVLSALNLYRFLLIMESSGNTNRTGVLSKDKLHKALHEWLLPLRSLVSGIEAENRDDQTEAATFTICAVNPVQLVLYHCIELVEERM